MTYVLYARRELSAIAEQYRDLTGVLKAVDSLLTQGWNITIEQTSTEHPAPTPHEQEMSGSHHLVDQIVRVTAGKHRGKEGRVSGVYPSKFNPGEFYATIHPTSGDKFYVDLSHIKSLSMPPAPSVRRPVVTRKANGSVPW